MPAPLRVLVLDERDPRHPRAGGAQVHIAAIFGRLARRGYSVTLACSRRTVGRWVASLRQALSGPATATWERYGGRIARLLPFATANLAIVPEVAH